MNPKTIGQEELDEREQEALEAWIEAMSLELQPCTN